MRPEDSAQVLLGCPRARWRRTSSVPWHTGWSSYGKRRAGAWNISHIIRNIQLAVHREPDDRPDTELESRT